MTTQHLLIAAIMLVAFAWYTKDCSLVGTDESVGWMLTATFVNAIVLGVVYLLAFGLVTVLS